MRYGLSGCLIPSQGEGGPDESIESRRARVDGYATVATRIASAYLATKIGVPEQYQCHEVLRIAALMRNEPDAAINDERLENIRGTLLLVEQTVRRIREDARAVPKPLTALEQRILDAIECKPKTAPEIARKLQNDGLDRGEDMIKKALASLRNKGLIANRRGRGYFQRSRN